MIFLWIYTIVGLFILLISWAKFRHENLPGWLWFAIIAAAVWPILAIWILLIELSKKRAK